MIGIARETGTGRFVRSNSPVLEGNPQSVTKGAADVSESLATTRHVSLKIDSIVGTMGRRNVFLSTNDPAPTDGAVGDIWLKY